MDLTNLSLILDETMVCEYEIETIIVYNDTEK